MMSVACGSVAPRLHTQPTLGGFTLAEIVVPTPFGRAILASGPWAGGDHRHLVGQANEEREPWVWTPATIRPYIVRVNEEMVALNWDVRRWFTGLSAPTPANEAFKERWSAAFSQWERFRNESLHRLEQFGLGFPGFAGYSDIGNGTRNWQVRGVEWRAQFRAQGGTPTGPEPEVPEPPEPPAIADPGQWGTALTGLGIVIIAALAAYTLFR